MSAPLSIYLGYDPREHAAYEVADFSIRRRAFVPVLITPLVLSQLGHLLTRPVERRDGKLWCPISQATMSTEFAISRFAVPFLQRTGWALFADCDVLCLSDIAELFALADPRYAVQVVKHAPMTATGTKMDGQQQTAYARKLWSSVVLWNCAHRANERLTPHILNTWPGRDLHAFCWLKDDEIGDLPQAWNWLVGVTPSAPSARLTLEDYRKKYPPRPGDTVEKFARYEEFCAKDPRPESVDGYDEWYARLAVWMESEREPKLLHFTLGGPWFPEWIGGPCDDLWIRERCSLTHPA